MGFFHVAEMEKPKVAARALRQKPFDPASSPRGCENCSLRANWNWITSAQMPISGNIKNPDILALGEAPGAEEDQDGIAFVGRSGRMLRGCIPGRDIDRLAFQNAARCRPRDNMAPSAADVHACGIHLEEDIAKLLSIKAILGIGSVPLAKFWSGQSITRIHGAKFPIEIAGRTLWYYPVLHPSFIMRSGDEQSPAMPILKSDIKRFFKEVDHWPTPKIIKLNPADVLLPASEAEARAYLAEMKAPYGIDLETQKLKPYLRGSELLSAAIADDQIAMAFPIDHPEAPNNWGLKLLLEVAASSPWIAHNLAFELIWLRWKAREAGIDWEPARIEDSMACGRIYHERETILSLEMLSRIHLGTDIKALTPRLNMSNMISEPLEKILPYNGLDAQGSAILWRMLYPAVKGINYERFLETIKSNVGMEMLGLETDPAITAELQAEWSGKQEAARIAASKIYEVKQFERIKQKEFNIGSSDDVGDALVEFGKIALPKTSRKGDDGRKVEGQKYATDDKTLQEHAANNPLTKQVIDFREAQLHKSTFCDAVERYRAEASDNRIHPSYTALHVATTRLSCEAPNAQNFPKRRHRGLRRQVIPDRLDKDGLPANHIFLKLDMGQIDARIYGCATKDRALCESFIRKEDIHGYWRDQVLDLYPAYIDRLALKTNEKDETKILKGARDIIKSDFVFATFYGSLARECAARTGIPLPIVTELLGRFWRSYPDALKWLKAQRQMYLDTGSVQTLCGIVRHGIMTGNEPINTPIQGSTAHIVNDGQNALATLSIQMDDPYLHPRINIHDDLTFVVPDQDDRIQGYIDIIAAEMVKVRYPWQIVPFTVEVMIGYDWSEFEQVAVITGDHVR
jgi:uracil-DNA glycosylase family 4